MGNLYQNTIQRLEPDITAIDAAAYYASAAISLKRIADSLEIIAASAAKVDELATKMGQSPPSPLSMAGMLIGGIGK